MTKIIFLCRHAQPVLTAGQKAGLSRTGEEQSRRLGARLMSELGSYVNDVGLICSPSQRCQETAARIGQVLQTSPTVLPLRFLQADRLAAAGDTGSKYSNYLANYQHLGIESPEAYVARLLRIVADQTKLQVIVIANEVNIRIVLQILGGDIYNTPIEHASCYKIILGRNKPPTIERIQ